MKKESKLTVAIVLGITIGTSVGVATGNLGLWIGVGVAIGVGVGTSLMKQENKDKGVDSNKSNWWTLYKAINRIVKTTLLSVKNNSFHLFVIAQNLL